jgi:acetoin utilization deacetylase AcuC-like enzyme
MAWVLGLKSGTGLPVVVMVAIVYSDEFLAHDTGAGHPESPERVKVCAQALHAASFRDQLTWIVPRLATRAELATCHPLSYVDQVARLAAQGGGWLDADTPVSPRSFEIAQLSAGAWLVGVDEVLDRQLSTFVLARPPGHHALPSTGMGFCIFANAAIAAKYALQKGCQRVAILDWDVHHGNGTQEIVEQEPQIAYCSLHQAPFYPGTGLAHESGAYENILNIPLPAGTGRLGYLAAFDQQVMLFLQRFQPDLLIVSAGFDATRADPLANMCLEPADFAAMTQRCLSVCPRLLLGLEGGYDLPALSQSVVQVVGALIIPHLAESVV